MIDKLSDMSDAEARLVLDNIQKIIQMADRIAGAGSSEGHEIYRLARDARDAMILDQVSRDTMRKLKVGLNPVIDGWEVSPRVSQEVRAGRKINAIKEFRTDTGLGLKEAKDFIEANWIELGGASF